MDDAVSLTSPSMIELTSDIVGAYVSNNNVPVADLPGLIASIHATLVGLDQPAPEPVEDHKVTAAQIRKSVTPDHITSFLDGKQYKSLKRHLTTRATRRTSTARSSACPSTTRWWRRATRPSARNLPRASASPDPARARRGPAGPGRNEGRAGRTGPPRPAAQDRSLTTSEASQFPRPGRVSRARSPVLR